MPICKHFAPESRVAQYAYELGLDREASEETRNPRVLMGDPNPCSLLESASRSRNPSTNFAVSWEEWVDDGMLQLAGRELIEDCWMVAVPRSRYAYTFVGHDETFKIRPRSKHKSRKKRSAIHGKIQHSYLPNGRQLQPIYPIRDGFLTTLLLSHLSIKYGWASPLDRSRARNGMGLTYVGNALAAKLALVDAAESVPRLQNGSPDAVGIVARWKAIGVDEVFQTQDQFGRRGVSIKLEDHPLPLRFFGEEYESINQLISIIEPNNENKRRHNSPNREDLFPGGYLVRDSEHASRISAALESYRAKRAAFNFKRYDLGRSTVALGSFIRSGRHCTIAHLGELYRPTSEGGTGSQSPTSGAAAADGRHNAQERANQSVEDKDQNHERPTKRDQSKNRSGTRTKPDTDVRGARPHIGIDVARAVGGVAAIAGVFCEAIRRMESAIGRVVSARIHGARELAGANHRLGVQNGFLDQAIERITAIMPQAATGAIAEKSDDRFMGESLRRVKKARTVTAATGLRPLMDPNGSNLNKLEPQ